MYMNPASYFAAFVITAVLVLLPLTLLYADTTDNKDSGKIVTIGAGEVVDRDFFAFGSRVEIYGTVNGDVYASARHIIIDGKIDGDLIAAGGTINIAGEITRSARIAGGQITITGEIGRNLTVTGGSINTVSSADIKGSFLAAAGSIHLASPVGGNARITAGNLVVSNLVNGDLSVAGGEIRLTSKAKITGSMTYWSNRDALIDRGAVVVGELIRKQPPGIFTISPESITIVLFGTYMLSILMSFISTLLLGLLFVYLFPDYMKKAAKTLGDKTLSCLGIGFLAFLITPFIALLLLITIIGVPFAFVLIGIYLLALYIAKVFVIFWAGGFILDRVGSRNAASGWTFLLGLLVYTALTIIPFIGGLVVLLTILLGLGAMLYSGRYGKLQTEKQVQ